VAEKVSASITAEKVSAPIEAQIAAPKPIAMTATAMTGSTMTTVAAEKP
jgi:hypothetical protein